MKRLLLATSLALLSLSSAAVLAAPGHGHGQKDGQGQGDEGGNGKDHGDKDKDHGNKDRGDRNEGDHHDRWARDYRHGDRDDRGNRYAYGHRAHHDNGRHLGQFRRGERVPDMYMQQRYYVNDYRAYHLAPPPRGYRWVRPDDGRYLLISTTTGLISQLLGY
jgi:Ni/Co efflux regulator RcnB